MRTARTLIVLVLALLASCKGPDHVRIASDRANLALAKRCADGWFLDLPFVAQDAELVRKAIGDWERALNADEAIVVGGAK